MQVHNLDRESPRAESRVVCGPRLVHDDATGEVMTVVERRADGTVGARGPTCLVFSTDRGFTRLWTYPADWIDLSDAELRTLSEYRRAQSA